MPLKCLEMKFYIANHANVAKAFKSLEMKYFWLIGIYVFINKFEPKNILGFHYQLNT